MDMTLRTKAVGCLVAMAALLQASVALAVDVGVELERIGKPVADGYNFQVLYGICATSSGGQDRQCHWRGICAIVKTLLLIVIVRYNSRANPKQPSHTQHQGQFVWTYAHPDSDGSDRFAFVQAAAIAGPIYGQGDGTSGTDL